MEPYPLPLDEEQIKKDMQKNNIKPEDLEVLLDTPPKKTFRNNAMDHDDMEQDNIGNDNMGHYALENIRFYIKRENDNCVIIFGIDKNNMPTIIFYRKFEFFDPIKYKEVKISRDKQSDILEFYKLIGVDINNDEHLREFLNNFTIHCLEKIS